MGSKTRSVSELLYEYYTEEIRESFREIDQVIRKLSVQENDRVFTLTCRLCSQHERLAFLEGLRVGMQLLLEQRI